MSDNSAVVGGTIADGTYAFDSVGGVKYSRSKIGLGTDGSATDQGGRDVGGSAGHGAYVVPIRTQDMTVVQSAGLTIATTAYTSGDVLGTAFTFPVARGTGLGGRIIGVRAVDLADVLGAIDIYLFTQAVTFGTDNAVPTISDADVLFYAGKVSVSFDDLGTSRVGWVDTINLPFKTTSDANLYGYVVTRTANAIFAAVTDLRIGLWVDRD